MRVDLLNEAAPTFFGMVQKVLWEDMLLHISRLTDAPASGMDKDKENLTIRNLPCLVKDRAIKVDLHKLVNTAEEKVKSIRDWRNHLIAHCNLDLAINNGSRPLAPADKAQVREAMHAIREVLTGLEQRYFTETVFIGSITHRGAFDLLDVLHFGIREKAKADERIRCRQATEDDYPALALTDET
jgi:AbiU2